MKRQVSMQSMKNLVVVLPLSFGIRDDKGYLQCRK